ncbi:MAG: glycosyltransferase family 4 protein [Proteobacteria bacterium]|nr:glycosyltransferase family 4 protein [Pseudomonadota bacterium]
MGVLRGLSRNSHHVHLVVFGRSGEKVEAVVENKQTGAMMMPGNQQPRDEEPSLASRLTKVPFTAKSHTRAFFSFRPGMIANRYSRRYVRAILDILAREEPFDAILVNHFKMSWLIKAIRPCAGDAAMILLTQNAEAPLCKTVYVNHENPVRKFAFYLDWLKMRRYEPRYLKQYDAVTAISREDADYFSRQYSLPNIAVVTPGIDLFGYPSNSPDPSKQKAVIVCGSFLWEPKKLNLLHLLNCEKFHLFAENHITLIIAGNADPAFVRHVNATYRGVKMTGWTPDVREHYAHCSIALIPEIMGGGFKLKIIEAAALKKAIVGLKGAVAAPGFENGTHFLEAANMDDLVEKTINLLSVPKTIDQLTRNAYDLLEKEYTVEAVYTKLLDVMTSVGLGNLQSIVFDASSRGHIEQTREMIEEAFAKR